MVRGCVQFIVFRFDTKGVGCSFVAVRVWFEHLDALASLSLQCVGSGGAENCCDRNVLLQSRFWQKAPNRVYSCTGSERGQQYNGAGQVGCSGAVWETPSHNEESKQRHRMGEKAGKGWRKLLFFPLFYFAAPNSTENISYTTGLIALEPSGNQRPPPSSLALQSKREKTTIKNIWSFQQSSPLIGGRKYGNTGWVIECSTEVI